MKKYKFSIDTFNCPIYNIIMFYLLQIKLTNEIKTHCIYLPLLPSFSLYFVKFQKNSWKFQIEFKSIFIICDLVITYNKFQKIDDLPF